MNAYLKKRWQLDPGITFLEQLEKWGRSGNGYDIVESPFGKVEGTGKLDLRGLAVSFRMDMRRLRFNNADFSEATLKTALLELSVFENVTFSDGTLVDVVEKGCIFSNCDFYRTNLKGSIMGYMGSKYRASRFIQSNFRKTGFIRPEFDNSSFVDCTFDGVDFNGGSFVGCEFSGELHGVWFRGNFPLSEDEAQWGVPRPNKMQNVSFKNAKFLDVTFSNNCDLSTVISPADGRHLLIHRWPEVLRILEKKSSEWLEPNQKGARNFWEVFKTHAQTQQWMLISLYQLKEMFGAEIGPKMYDQVRAVVTNFSVLSPSPGV